MRQPTLPQRVVSNPGRSPIVGAEEVATLLGWARRRVSRYYQEDKLPAPLAELACGPIWRREDIEAFANDEPLPLPHRSGPETTKDGRRITSIEGSVQAFGPWFRTAVALFAAADDRNIPDPVKDQGCSAKAVWSAAQLGLAFAVTAVLAERPDVTESTGMTKKFDTAASADPDIEQLFKRALSLLNWRSGGWEYKIRDGELCRRKRGMRAWDSYELDP